MATLGNTLIPMGPSCRQSILVVDDQPDLVTLLTEILLDEGYCVRQAFNGIQALAEIDLERPDAIISNIMMPLLDGIQLAAELRERGDMTPIILISAARERHSGPGLVFVSKPFDLPDLVELVDRLITGQGSAESVLAAS